MIINLPDTDDITKDIAEIQNELTVNNVKLYFDYKDGKYGYNTDPKRGADTFNPFKSGDSGDNIYTKLTTVSGVKGDQLPTITGSGYIILRRLGGGSGGYLDVYIDGNTQSFKIASEYNYGITGDFWKFYFQESIRFSIDNNINTYYYQTLLSEKTVPKKYNIIQGVNSGSSYSEITGKGRALISPASVGFTAYYIVDNGTENSISFRGNQHLEIMFTKSLKIYSGSTYNQLYYLAYVEIEE